MKYFLGIDGGGTSTICYLANEAGEILGQGKAGASVYHVTGIERAIKEIKISICGALKNNQKITKVDTACFGLAGVDSEKDYDTMYRALSKEYISEQVILENDAVIALVGGNAKDHGVVLIAGTGAISYGINQNGDRRRAGGWGHLVGDEGSGYNISIRGITAALRAYDGRGEETILLPMFKEKLQLGKMEDIMEKIYLSLSREEIASMAYVVFQAARQGDGTARDIILNAGKELAQNLKAVIKNLKLSGEEIEIPLVGGVFKSESDLLIEAIKGEVLELAPEAKIIRPRFNPAIGAVILALYKSGIKLNGEIMANLKESSAVYN